jgi:hypothetical protein
MSDVQLFSSGGPFGTGGGLADSLAQTAKAISQRLRSMDANELLNAPVQDVVDELVEAGSVECPQLDVNAAFMLEPTEIDQGYQQFDRSYSRKISRFVLVVPFTGEKDVFTVCPDSSTMVRPQVLALNDQQLRLAVDDPPNEPAAVKEQFDEQIAAVEKYLSWSRPQIDNHNRQMREEVPVLVTRRREELLATRNLQAAIGYPIRRRSDADTYSTPVKRRAVRPQRGHLNDARGAYKPEPTMAQDDYDAALQVLRSQRNALERNPSVAEKLDEEEIRNLLLIGLNAQFEGLVGGELFNGSGKTDILIRVDDRNIFIGECKVWSGPKTMEQALDQLFGYLVWRDTKAAILLFVRNKDVSAVIRKAIDKIREHPNHKRSKTHEEIDAEQYEFTMCATGDREREIHLALIPFALRPTSDAGTSDA